MLCAIIHVAFKIRKFWLATKPKRPILTTYVLFMTILATSKALQSWSVCKYGDNFTIVDSGETERPSESGVYCIEVLDDFGVQYLERRLPHKDE